MNEEIVDLAQSEKVELKEKPKTIIYEVDGVKLPEVAEDFKMPIKYYPDPFLGVFTEKILYEKDKKQFSDKGIHTLISQMIQTMYNNVGIGLAAPQIGVPYQLFVWDTNWPNSKKREPNIFINPEIVEKSGTLQTNREGCLSIALGWHVDIPRSEEVVIKGLNIKGEETQLAVEGITAACFQHELDHLKGKLIVDYDGKMRRSLYDKKIIKFARRRRNAYNKTRKELIRLQKANVKVSGKET